MDECKRSDACNRSLNEVCCVVLCSLSSESEQANKKEEKRQASERFNSQPNFDRKQSFLYVGLNSVFQRSFARLWEWVRVMCRQFVSSLPIKRKRETKGTDRNNTWCPFLVWVVRYEYGSINNTNTPNTPQYGSKPWALSNNVTQTHSAAEAPYLLWTNWGLRKFPIHPPRWQTLTN